MFFPYLNREKGGELTAGDDVAIGPGGKLTWRASQRVDATWH